MAKISIQKLLQNWEQLCNQLGDALHDPAKFDKVCKAATPFNSTYKTWYINAGIVECIGKKNKISSEFMLKKNRQEMLEFFLEFYREKNPIKQKEPYEVQEQQDEQDKQDSDDLQEKLIEAICLLEDNGYIVWTPEEADNVLQGLKLIVSAL